MIFRQRRQFYNEKYSFAFLQNDESTYRAFVVEDTYHPVKVPGQTRIPAGFFELKIREEATPLTIKHRKVYNKAGDEWFEFHIEVTGIPNFKDVYVHMGLDQDWTEGCITPGYTFDLTLNKRQQGRSDQATRDFYEIAYPLLKAGKRCWIEITDEPKVSVGA